MPEESYIDFKYRMWLFESCLKKPEITKLNGNTAFSLECPLCGAKGSHLVWLHHKSTWKFLCSTKSRKNCQCQLEFPVLLQRWNEPLYLSYRQERFEAGTTGAGFNCPSPMPHERKRKPLGLRKRPKCHDQNQPTGISTSP